MGFKRRSKTNGVVKTTTHHNRTTNKVTSSVSIKQNSRGTRVTQNSNGKVTRTFVDAAGYVHRSSSGGKKSRYHRSRAVGGAFVNVVAVILFFVVMAFLVK